MPKKITPPTPADLQASRLEERVIAYTEGRLKYLPSLGAKTSFVYKTPILTGLGDRSNTIERIVLPMWQRLITGKDATDASKVLDPKYAKNKVRNNADYVGTYNNFNGVLRPEYDMLEPFVIFDTEAYVKRAIGRRLDLMFRNGYEIATDLDQETDQGQKNIDYINKRLQTIEYITDEPTNAFFKKLLFNLLLCSNCFLRKIRDEELSAGSRNKAHSSGLPDNNNKIPVAHYQLIPAHTILPYFEKGKIIKWRRFFDTGTPYQDYSLEEILHIKWDIKPGHVYGTPRTVGVRDDIWALRRLEENIELLFVNHLFPFFHVKIGNEKAPCWYGPNGESEIDTIRYQIETMPKEGIFVSDARVEVDVVGAEGKSLEVKEFLEHLKSRVFTGLGVSGIDMGEGADATRATADNISQNLKDTVKADMESFGDAIRLNFFKEWFMEAPYSVSVQKAVATTKLTFHEIDMDNLIKEQSHTLNMYNGHLLSEPEARKNMKKPPMTKKDKNLTHYKEHVVDLVQKTAEAKSQAEVKAQKELLPLQAKHQEEMTGHKVTEINAQHKLEHKKMETHVAKAAASVKLTNAKTKLASVQGPRLGGTAKKATPSSRTTKNRVQPSNQHKVNAGPTRAKSSREELQEILSDNLLQELQDNIGTIEWSKLSSDVIDRVLAGFETTHSEDPDDPTNDYTRKVRQELASFKDMIAQTTDPEMLTILIDAWDGENDGQ